ncbi:sensor histidine kinase [Segetibacter koreensis]|uniref:sensor histidine kinase n=1 Tax=Segetibacter koreensis TaxID=398037 RepID=UPI00036EDDE8|nr:ATP-binding protein [Segetibacter koreensis]
MNQIIDFFSGLFDTSLWPARWHCGYWSDFHGWLYIISDMMVWAAYFLMPIIIIRYASEKRTGLKFHKAYLLFAAFIVLCGSTHFLDALMFWVPVYRLNAVVRFVTGVVSLATLFYLIKILPEVFKQKTNAELEKEIAKRQEAEKKLGEVNKGLEAFAYIASHDLQEPLRKIRTFSSLLQKANENTFDERSKELAQKINSSTQRMQNMIHDVLTLSTINEEVEMVSVQTVDVIDSAKEDLEIKLLEKNAVIHCGPLPMVKGNPAFLTQLFSNLLSNAIKFCVGQPIINIRGEQKGERVFIYVADNGIGMNKEDSKSIFIAFKRLHSRGQFEGAGIGLAICKKIINIHNGIIYVESEPGRGTTFIIELPAAV